MPAHVEGRPYECTEAEGDPGGYGRQTATPERADGYLGRPRLTGPDIYNALSRSRR